MDKTNTIFIILNSLGFEFYLKVLVILIEIFIVQILWKSHLFRVNHSIDGKHHDISLALCTCDLNQEFPQVYVQRKSVTQLKS